MKKLYLLLTIVMIVSSVMAQRKYVPGSKSLANRVLREKQVSPDGKVLNSEPYIIGQKSRSVAVVGNTFFETQTNGSGNLMNRIFEYPDGNIGATWMHQGEGGVPDRGTGYNIFDGTSWGTQAPHLGNDSRNGFPSYAPWGPDGEVISHYQYIANEGPIKILRRENKGEGNWVESVLAPPDGNYSLVWHSMITSGPNHEYIHLLAFVYDDPYVGQDDALLYYRSSDGGVTWDINGVIIDGLGVDYFPSISSLRYSWAQPVGNTIAFTYGFSEFDGLVFKSTDNGNTWQKIVVYQAPFDPYDLPDITPTFGGGDGTSAIALDSQGKVHVVFGRMSHIHDVVTTPPGGWYFYPATEGMIYWNETMPVLDSTIVSSYTLDFLIAGGNLIGWVFPPDPNLVIPTDQPNYGVGLTSGPQFGIDTDDNLFVVWSALAPLNNDGTFFYRHLYGNSSPDGGDTWNGIRDLNEDVQFFLSECVYPAVSPLVDQKVHVVFQEDASTGTAAGQESNILHMDFDKDLFVGLPGAEITSGFKVSQNSPNPATRSTQFGVWLEQPGDASVTVTNLVGQTVKKLDMGKMNSGNNLITLNVSDLKGGIYFYSVQVNDQNITHKMVVQQ